MAYESQQPNDYDPAFSMVTPVSMTWATDGNAKTVTDASCHPHSAVLVNPTTIPNGFWKVVPAQGSFTITSSDSESSGLGFNYRIF
jgi:hypothetical protein